VILVAEQEVQREDAGLRRHRGSIGGGGDDEVDIPGAKFLEHHRLLAELRARELIDAQLAAAQLLELGIENIGGDAIGS
jgi:hypothetical protein